MKYFLISLLPAVIYLLMYTKKTLHMLQQNRYNEDNRYLKWIKINSKKVFININYLYLLIFAFSFFLKSEISMILFFSFYLIIIFVLCKETKKEQVKKPLAVTSRVKRLWVTTMILYSIPVILCCIFYRFYLVGIYYFIIGSLIYFNYFVVYLANIINKPIEKSVYLYYKYQANKKLTSMNHMEVIGITGSYGKTSTKNVVGDILNEKYIAFKTPQNYNTAYGLINTINNYLDKYSNYFIAEMGTLKPKDIKIEASIVKPKYGILTKIGTAHLEAFGNIENIAKEKFALIESLPSDGVAILNKDDEYQINYKLKNSCKVLWYGIDSKADVNADNIKYSKDGMTFDVYIQNKKYEFKTKLLGSANIYNILAGITLANELGLSIEQMQRGVSKIRPVEHRLELRKYGNINYIDDAYNSNPIGSKMALDVLNLMPGKKIVITPGMIELADKQYEYNFQFGQYIAKVADLTILVGEKQTKPIADGLKKEKYEEDKLLILNDVKEAIQVAQNMFKGEVYILLENDLPDIFNEK